MARPRVFVSSTFYDLKHIRSSLDIFIDSLGYDSILSEKGDIAYAHDVPLDQSCYREVATADIFVLIVGGRYGSAASREERDTPASFYDRYTSVTKLEHAEAVQRDIPVYILVESPVHAEYQTYLRNKDSKTISYAHVESVNVFVLLEDILALKRNNPIKTFERFSDIASWLREQWAGLFREYLNRTSSQQQLTALAGQVSALQEASATLKRYLEEVVSKVSPDDSAKLIKAEETRLADARRLDELQSNRFIRFLFHYFNSRGSSELTIDTIREALTKAQSLAEFGNALKRSRCSEALAVRIVEILTTNSEALDGFNEARQTLGLAPIKPEEAEGKERHTSPRRRRTSRRDN